VKPYLPPESSQFKILLTAREEFGRPIKNLSLDKLQPDAALDLLKSLVGVQRIQQELEIAEQLCRQFLDYLPLGLELVGRYLERSPDLSLKAMLSLLEKKRLRHKSVLEADATMTAKLGVADAFELSWERLDEDAQFLGCLLSLFASADIPWWLVEVAYDNMLSSEDEKIDLEFLVEARGNLLRFNLLQRTDKESYHLHLLIRDFLQEKREQSVLVDLFKPSFVWVMVELTKRIPNLLTRQQVQFLSSTMPHVAEVAKEKDLRNLISDDEMIWPFSGLGRFYMSQGLYEQAELWAEQCLSITLNCFGTEHSAVANSLNNLATLYNFQGRYREAEPLHLQSLSLHERLLVVDHFGLATSLNNLANLYHHQGRYKEAEPLYQQALSLHKRFLLEDHSDVAMILNNLGWLYSSQSRYSEAETLFLQALELCQGLWGEDHPGVAMILHNLALLYDSQNRYEEAETLCLQSLSLCKRLFGEDHPKIAASLCGLASVYKSQGRYGEAEPLLLQAVELCKRTLGEDHPHLATSLNNLAGLYYYQGRYSEAKPLLLEALELQKRLLGKEHPEVATTLNSLANLCFSDGRYEDAEFLYLGALEICEQRLGSIHPYTISSQKSLAMVRDHLNSTTKDLGNL
jgi:tetratricopeptide (TPR) repeat protein